MTSIMRTGIRGLLRLVTGSLAALTLMAGPSWAAQQIPAGNVPAGQAAKYKMTVNYVTEFFPLWLTYLQSLYSTENRLAGPDRVTSLYQIVVAINVDTLYASTFLNLAAEPVILTVPSTTVRYSVLVLDPYGDVVDTGISTTDAGVYALTGPDFSGKVPKGTTQIALPLNHMVIIFRADKFSSSGVDQRAEAETFRESLLMQPRSDWKKDPSGGATRILPELFFAVPFKTVADGLIETDPVTFLQQLQSAVHSSFAPPLSEHQQKLSDKFDKQFAGGDSEPAFVEGARTAHEMILQNYLTHLGSTYWINFTNIGEWKTHQSLDRSGIAEFIQYGNNHDTAAYYHTFRDSVGKPLDGTDPKGYVLRIPKKKIPDAARFWSFTVYTPQAIELVRNDADKYEIASYTSGLHYNSDGSLTLYFAGALPSGVNEANWVPIPSGPFNVMLRVYGPQGDVADATYVPPGIVKR
jgi:hypothetical protein